MGAVVHTAIVVTSWDAFLLTKAHGKAGELIPGLVTEIVESRVNVIGSFAVLPDGSKQGWKERETADRQRAEFIDWMHAQAYRDGSNALHFVCIDYGETGRGSHKDEPEIRDHSYSRWTEEE